jgi:hypothetical protein
MRIIWDLDGTLLKDTGKDYDKNAETTPLKILLDELSEPCNEFENICVTGRTTLPMSMQGLFDEVYCRDWQPADWDKYYPQYFQWKVDTILKLQPDLVFEDDQQITRYLTKKGINVVWTPQYSYMGA